MIYHLALPDDWAEAATTGFYPVSTRGRTIAEQGFLHASKDLDQTRRVHDCIYSGVPDLLLLHIDEQRLTAAGLEVQMEPASATDPTSELFPHVYGGPLPTNAVVDVTQWTI